MNAGEVLIDQRLEEGLLGGMWEFPGGKQEAIGETIDASPRDIFLVVQGLLTRPASTAS